MPEERSVSRAGLSRHSFILVAFFYFFSLCNPDFLIYSFIVSSIYIRSSTPDTPNAPFFSLPLYYRLLLFSFVSGAVSLYNPDFLIYSFIVSSIYICNATPDTPNSPLFFLSLIIYYHFHSYLVQFLTLFFLYMAMTNSSLLLSFCFIIYYYFRFIFAAVSKHFS